MKTGLPKFEKPVGYEEAAENLSIVIEKHGEYYPVLTSVIQYLQKEDTEASKGRISSIQVFLTQLNLRDQVPEELQPNRNFLITTEEALGAAEILSQSNSIVDDQYAQTLHQAVNLGIACAYGLLDDPATRAAYEGVVFEPDSIAQGIGTLAVHQS
jgi:hypothetical protein